MALMTVKQVSTLLNISPATVYALVADGKLTAHRFGLKRGTIRISEEALREYQEGAKVEPKRPTIALKHLTLT
ncbi:MAG: helix-turn-helix domain-containing protein [Gemmataceae bacterium]